ncbi:hypothetical protein, partial [Xanthomonas sp. SHU 166]|uniref:hypothetical protein n=1 Tax=Xanthomonas sp. SHU 166 TaxID=1591170 RepID=UPI001E34C320
MFSPKGTGAARTTPCHRCAWRATSARLLGANTARVRRARRERKPQRADAFRAAGQGARAVAGRCHHLHTSDPGAV